MKNISVAGRLTRDSKQRDAGGQPVLGFSVAVDDRVRVDGQWVKQALFFECSLWGQRGATLAQYMTRGKAVCVSGELSVREYQKNNGTPGFGLTIRVEQVSLMGGRDDAQAGEQGGGRYANQGQAQLAPRPATAPTSVPPAGQPFVPMPVGEFDDIPFAPFFDFAI